MIKDAMRILKKDEILIRVSIPLQVAVTLCKAALQKTYKLFTNRRKQTKTEGNMNEKIDPIKLTLPRPVAVEFPISSLVGWRKINGKPDFHSGIDFAVPPGTPVKAVADGICFRSGWENEQNQKQGFGLRIWQEFKYEDFMVYAWYGHLSVTLITEGANIVKGQVIGMSGSTGRSTGPHLHIEFRRKNTPIRFDVVWKDA